MFLFYFSIALAILSSALYHFSAKSAPEHANFSVSLLVTYAIALGVTLLTLFFFPMPNGIVAELKQLNWATVLMALAVVGIEFGFLLCYRAGWNVGLTAIIVNVAASLILLPIAIFLFKDKVSWVNLLGIVVCLVGLVMLNWKK